MVALLGWQVGFKTDLDDLGSIFATVVTSPSLLIIPSLMADLLLGN